MNRQKDEELLEIEAEESEKVKRGRLFVRRLEKCFSALAVALVVTVLALLFIRLGASKTPSQMRALTVTEPVKTAYAENGTLTLRYQNQDSITRGENNAGYFSVPEYCFIDECDGLQLVFRFNKSTLGHVAEDYSLESVPSREENPFDVTVAVVYKDGRTERFFPVSEQGQISNRYNFCRYAFENVKITGEVEAIYADVYYKGAVDYESESYGSLRLYNFDNPYDWKYQKLSKQDKENLTK